MKVQPGQKGRMAHTGDKGESKILLQMLFSSREVERTWLKQANVTITA